MRQSTHFPIARLCATEHRMAILESLKARRTGVRFHGPVCPIWTMSKFFVDRETAGIAIVTYAEGYVPIESEMKARILRAITAVIQAGERV